MQVLQVLKKLGKCIILRRALPGVTKHIPVFNNDRDARRERIERMKTRYRVDNPTLWTKAKFVVKNWRASLGILCSFATTAFCEFNQCIAEARSRGLNLRDSLWHGGKAFFTQ